MSSSTKAEAFSFDTEFTSEGEVLNEGGRAFKRYTMAEMQALCDEARAEAMASVEADTERALSAAAQSIVQAIAPSGPILQAMVDALRAESVQLAMMVARRIVGEALEQFAEESVKASVTDALATLPKKVAIELLVAPDLVDRLKDHIADHTPAGVGISVVPDSSAQPGQWRLVWEGGQLSADPSVHLDRIDELVTEHLSQPTPIQGDLFAGAA